MTPSISCGARGVLAALAFAALVAPAPAADDKSRALAEAYNNSGRALFVRLAANPGNLVISPYSIGVAMDLALAGARGGRTIGRRDFAISLTVLLGIALAGPAIAQASKRVDLNVDKKSVILGGYDPVAYFTARKPTRGSDKFSTEHDGARYLFASAANRDAFLKEPAKYVPAYGGWCAMGVTFERKVPIDPKVWRVVDGRLYVNANAAVGKRWAQDVPGNIAKAEEIWPTIKDKEAAALDN